MKKDSTFFPQSPYLADHMPGIYKALIATKPAFISYQVYVDQNNYAHYGLPHYREFEYLFVSNEKERENFILAGIPEKRITVSGHPLVFETNLFLQNATDAVRGQKVLLWAPHWELDWSHWEITLAAISEFLDANDDWKVRFRPHPLFLSSLEGKLPAGYRGVSPSSEKSLATLRAFLRSNRIERSRAGLVRDVLECHALITEGKTLPAVWEISGKPMAVISENPEEKFVDYWSSKNERVFLNPRPEHICTRLDQIASSQNASHAVNTNQSPWLLYRDGKPIDPGAVIAETVNL